MSWLLFDMLLYSQFCTPYFIESRNTHKGEMHGRSFSNLFVVVLCYKIHWLNQPCMLNARATCYVYTSIHDHVDMLVNVDFKLSFPFLFSLLMSFDGLTGVKRCLRFVRRCLCCRRRLPHAVVQKLWVDWTYRCLLRAQRLAERKDFALAGELRKCNKARCRKQCGSE